MYMDENIILSENLPTSLKEEISELEKLYKMDDDLAWMRLMEMIDVETRDLIVSGRISKEEGYDVLRKFGWR